MSKSNKTNFRYLNADGRWPHFNMNGLEVDEKGRLQLYSLPLLEGELPEGLAGAEKPVGPAGIAVDSDGTIYFSDPKHNKLLKIDACDGVQSSLACVGGQGNAISQFNIPRGLLILKHRRSLFVADSDNHRVQVFDLDSNSVVDIWGQADQSGEPEPGTEPGRFDTPWTLAGDHLGNAYVVDYGNSRVQKFNRAGDLVPSFWDTIDQREVLAKPSDIAVYSDQGSTLVYIVDQSLHRVFAFDEDGNVALDGEGCPISFGVDQLQEPMGIAVDAEAVYVGDNAHRRVLKFDRRNGYKFVGEAVGYRGPVAALAFAAQGELLVHTGTSLPPLRLATGKGFQSRGVLWSEAISVGDREVKWHRLDSEAQRYGTSAHLRLFVHTSSDPADAPTVDPLSADPFADQRWRPRSDTPGQFADVDDLFIDGEPANYLWVGALFSGDGESTPVVSQMLVEYDHTTYLEHLPAIYLNQLACGDFLVRFLSLAESLFGDVEASIEDLSKLFDPFAAPQEFLPWLATWLALELDEDWDEQTQRQAIASAFEMYGRRGTARGLRESLRFYAGVDAIIEEPILSAEWWALPAESIPCACKGGAGTAEKAWVETENSILGVTTMLAPAHAQGAVVGATATLDQSHLISNAELGAPLFLDVAHQFTVQIYRGQLSSPETQARVHDVIRREKPAHTAYHLCVIEPRLRVGYQARVGIDTVVAGPPAPVGLGDERGVVLGGQPAARIGEASSVGITTRVG